MGDLGTTGLSILSLNQREGNGQDKEEGQEKVAEIHGCELPLLKVDAVGSRRERGRSRVRRPACNGVRRCRRGCEVLYGNISVLQEKLSVNWVFEYQ
jgi:hypothetical protein